MSFAAGTDADGRDPDLDAAEYVLGLASGDAAAEIEARLASDGRLRAAVASWRERLLPLDATAAAITPPSDLWSRIEALLASPRQSTNVRRLQPRASTPQRGSSRAWTAGLSALAACLGFLAAFVAFGLRQSEQPTAVAVLLSPDARAGAIVQVFEDNRVVVLPITEIAVPADRSLQVWTLYDQARGPVSLGLMEGPRRSGFYAVGTPLTRPDQLYEITLEPAGGSTIGRPTGPILFKGNAALVR